MAIATRNAAPYFFCRYDYDDTRILSEQCGGRIPRVPDFEYERHVFARPEQMHVDRVHHENVRDQVTLTPEDQAELQDAGQQDGGHRAAVRLHHHACHDQQRVLEPLRAVPRRPGTEVFHHRTCEGEPDCGA